MNTDLYMKVFLVIVILALIGYLIYAMVTGSGNCNAEQFKNNAKNVMRMRRRSREGFRNSPNKRVGKGKRLEGFKNSRNNKMLEKMRNKIEKKNQRRAAAGKETLKVSDNYLLNKIRNKMKDRFQNAPGRRGPQGRGPLGRRPSPRSRGNKEGFQNAPRRSSPRRRPSPGRRPSPRSRGNKEGFQNAPRVPRRPQRRSPRRSPRSRGNKEGFQNAPSKTLVLYYANWCPHCKRFMNPGPTELFQQLKSEAESRGYVVSALDCANGCDKPEGLVRGFPTIVLNGSTVLNVGNEITPDVLSQL